MSGSRLPYVARRYSDDWHVYDDQGQFVCECSAWDGKDFTLHARAEQDAKLIAAALNAIGYAALADATQEAKE